MIKKFKINTSMCTLLVFSLLICCNHTEKNWIGGAVWKPGTYVHKDSSIKLKVYIDDKFVRYIMWDNKNNELLRSNRNISDLHKWVIYLDKGKSLWVLSSDIGDARWSKTPSGIYTYEEFGRHLTKIEMPPEIENDIAEYFE